MNLLGTSIIGQRRAEPHGKTLSALNAATGEALGTPFHTANLEDVDQAALLAAKAFITYRKWPGEKRSELLRRIAELLEENAVAIVERAQSETSLPAARLQGEMGRTCGQLRLFASLVEEGSWVDARIDHADPARKPAAKPDVRSMLIPLGPVAVFGASNFPLAFSVAGGDTASALAAGCPVIAKAHEAHMGTSEMVGTLIQQAADELAAPEGLFSLLQGAGKDVGTALVNHPSVKAVAFTGSGSVGRALMDLAAARPEPIPVYAEMGSINPVFLLGGALNGRAAQIAAGLHGSVTLGVGQFCTNPGLVILEKSDGATVFQAALAGLMQNTSPGTMLTRGILENYQKRLDQFVAVDGVNVLAKAEANGASAGAALLTTDARTFLTHPLLLSEVFGPSTLLVQCTSQDELRAVGECLDGQLTATIHGTPEDIGSHEGLVSILETKAGRLVYNGYPTGVEVGHAIHHGGPYPATGDGRTTSVGTRAIARFARPICYQDFPESALPEALWDTNPLGLRRFEDGKMAS